MTKEDDANNARYAEFRARSRREQIVTMAKRSLVLQFAHHGALWVTGRSAEEQREMFHRKAREALGLAEAFMDEADKVLLP